MCCMRSNFGHSTFHSGTVKLEKRFSRGFFFNTFYTFSKSINSQDTDNSGGRELPRFRTGHSKRLVPAMTAIIAGSRSLTTNCRLGEAKKFGTGVSGWKNMLIGGWEISLDSDHRIRQSD